MRQERHEYIRYVNKYGHMRNTREVFGRAFVGEIWELAG